MKLSRDFMRFYIIPVVLLIGMIVTAGFIVFYTGTAGTQDGKTVASNWPRDFTLGFSKYITYDGEKPQVTEEGTKLLQEYGLWLQILNADGTEVASYDRPSEIPSVYQPYELLEAYQYGIDDDSVFVSHITEGEEDYTYIIGFPLNISKITMYIDTARYHAGRTLIIATVVTTALLMLALTIFYNMMIMRNLTRIRESLKAVAERNYIPSKRKPFLREVYEGIELLDQDIAAADASRAQDEKAKEEWLANITHDLKTPLAPIRGYAELMVEEAASKEKAQDIHEERTMTDGISSQDMQRYGEIILKNTMYVEQLVDDLKLTYQLQSNMLPLYKEKINIARFVKEVVIDLLNTPDYENRNVVFQSESENIECEFDAKLMRRALTNIIVNALKHNSTDTTVTVLLSCKEGILLSIADNGSGMTAEELDGLFRRYYRGTSTEVQTEGTGLGMAIARQIIEAHGGKIEATSTVGKGTAITIQLIQI